jgi:starch phosphorylase
LAPRAAVSTEFRGWPDLEDCRRKRFQAILRSFIDVERFEMTELFQKIPVGPTTTLQVPKAFKGLIDLAYNLWWSWDDEAAELWHMIDARRWSENPNPIVLLSTTPPDLWEALAANPVFNRKYSTVMRRFEEETAPTGAWYDEHHENDLEGSIAYLCAEYGIVEKLRLYSGGLGILAGDHVKAASDLGIPLIGVGLLYRRGYFQQAIDPDGNQEHMYRPIETARRPLREVLDPQTGHPLRVEVHFPNRTVKVAVWRLDVGRIPLLLLDTDIAANDPADRPITHILYVRGREMRFAQEAVLGIGGTRALRALGIEPQVWHVNEGHSALSLIERMGTEMTDGATFEEAKARVMESTLFTLHTPVPAGNESFATGVALPHIQSDVPAVPIDEVEELARAGDGAAGWFDMGALAIRLSKMTNGVSQRHAKVVSNDWGHILEGVALCITNGIHPQSWVGPHVAALFRRHIGQHWANETANPEAWNVIDSIPDEELWAAHVDQKAAMLRDIRTRLRNQRARHGSSPDRLREVNSELPDDRLTLVFARRFATYKRAGLIFSDPGRARALLTNPERPVQLIFAGKAHPADREGQGLIRWVNEMAHSADLHGHIAFIENYNIAIGKALVSGADVWLNTPRPPKEASGTSGMKASANGGLNLSVLDGWWVEGFEDDNGWGFGETSHSDAEDAGTLYHLLEAEVIPRYYDRDAAGIPREWVAMMKRAIISGLPGFSTQRMLIDYTEKAYLPIGRGTRS